MWKCQEEFLYQIAFDIFLIFRFAGLELVKLVFCCMHFIGIGILIAVGLVVYVIVMYWWVILLIVMFLLALWLIDVRLEREKKLEAKRLEEEAERLEREKKLEAKRLEEEAERLEREKKLEAERLEEERVKQEAERLEEEAKRLRWDRWSLVAEKIREERAKQAPIDEAKRLEEEKIRLEREKRRLEEERVKQEAERLEREKFDINFKTACKEFLETQGYLQVLVRKQRQLVFKDDYGDYIFDNWNKELERFVENKTDSLWLKYFEDYLRIYHFDGDDYDKALSDFDEKLCDIFNTMVDDAEIEEPQAMAELDMIADPLEYENKICEVFTNCGWNAQVTKASGDQGVDVIAELDGVHVAVQCKLYSSPVGNGAVQEVFAAKSHYDCQIAMVVTNSFYTKSAKQLASTCGVELLHHDELVDWITTRC